MRIAVIDQTGDVVGGAQESLELFLRHRSPDIEPVVVFFRDGTFAERVRKIGISTVIAPLDPDIETSKRERVPLAAIRKVPNTVRALRTIVRTIDPAVVYTNGIKAHMLGSLTARTLGIPSVVHHRDILSGPARFALLGTIWSCSRTRIATSRNVARCYPLPATVVVDNPIDLAAYDNLPDRSSARAKLGILSDEPVAAIVGRINRWKGVDRFLRAIARVNERTPLRGLIVGDAVFRDADLVPELHALCSHLGIAHLITFAGWAADPRDVYAGIDINVNASHREPFGRTIIEAAACGVPSVCFDDSGVSETMESGTTGLVVSSSDDRAFADALETYARDSVARRTAGDAARAWSRRFDAGRHAHRIGDILRAAAVPRRRKDRSAGA